MNKEEQIKETERWLCRICSHYETCNNSCEKRKDFAEVLYNAGYRKVLDSEAELQELNIKYYNEAKDLRRQLADAEAENKRLSAKLGQILLSINTVKEMNAMCDINDHRKQAVKEFAEKLKEKYGKSCSEYYPILIEITSDDIDELLKEYE